MTIFTCIVDTKDQRLVSAVVSLNDRPLNWEKIVRKQYGQGAAIYNPQVWLDVPVEKAMEAAIAQWREKRQARAA